MSFVDTASFVIFVINHTEPNSSCFLNPSLGWDHSVDVQAERRMCDLCRRVGEASFHFNDLGDFFLNVEMLHGYLYGLFLHLGEFSQPSSD